METFREGDRVTIVLGLEEARVLAEVMAAVLELSDEELADVMEELA